ncbi:hypothetical protein [Dactylosporangium darangshiense]
MKCSGPRAELRAEMQQTVQRIRETAERSAVSEQASPDRTERA